MRTRVKVLVLATLLMLVWVLAPHDLLRNYVEALWIFKWHIALAAAFVAVACWVERRAPRDHS